jgi:hypothetical protein
MSSIDTVRVIIQDTPLYAKEELPLDGTQKSIQLYYFPVVASSVVLTGTALPGYSFDEDNGVITFVSAPGAQTMTAEYKHVLLLDAAIQTLIDVEDDDDLRLASADCLDSIASSQALIQKKIKVLDLETDGPSLAKALRDHAAMLRKQVFDKSMNESVFDLAEQINNSAGFWEKIRKDWMRQQV